MVIGINRIQLLNIDAKKIPLKKQDFFLEQFFLVQIVQEDEWFHVFFIGGL
jgi:hypothetical protein